MTGLADKRRAVVTDDLDFVRAFNALSSKIFTEKVAKYTLDEETLEWIDNWLNGQAQKMVIVGTV